MVGGWLSYGGPGVALALTVIVFWLLLQFSQALRTLRIASANPVGFVANAVMLNAKLKAGMRLPEVLVLTRALWAGGHRYGVVLWSSDIQSSFEQLASMVPQGVGCACACTMCARITQGAQGHTCT